MGFKIFKKLAKRLDSKGGLMAKVIEERREKQVRADDWARKMRFALGGKREAVEEWRVAVCVGEGEEEEKMAYLAGMPVCKSGGCTRRHIGKLFCSGRCWYWGIFLQENRD